MVPLTNIDLIEREYLLEYDKIIQKDKEEGKDFNMLAYNDLKRAQYYFKYLRESEKMYKAEPDWRENKESDVKKGSKESKAKEDKSVRTISLDAVEKDLFKSPA